MNKSFYISRMILMLFLILFMMGTSFIIKEWDNGVAVVDGFRFSEEEIENIIIENQKEVDKALAKYPDLHFRNLTEEEIEALATGKIDEEDVSLLVTGKAVYQDGEVVIIDQPDDEGDASGNSAPDTDTNDEDENTDGKGGGDDDKPKDDVTTNDNNHDGDKVTGQNGNGEGKSDKTDSKPSKNNNTTKPQTPSQPAAPETDPRLAQVLEKFYVLKANFLADIESNVSGMISEYKSLPKEQKTEATRSAFANRAISLMAEKEPVYDAQFAQVISELESVVSVTGTDASIVDTVREAYRREKAATKAKYVSRARKHL